VVLGLLVTMVATSLSACSYLRDWTCARTGVEAQQVATALGGQGFSPYGVRYACNASEGGYDDEVGIWMSAAEPPAGVTRRGDLVRTVAEALAPAGWKVMDASAPEQAVADHEIPQV
jgi:hypothetical protein